MTLGHFDLPRNRRAKIVGADGQDIMKEWEPPGFTRPAEMPTSVIDLSGNGRSKHIHEMSENEIREMLKKRRAEWHRCPICATPFETTDARAKCAAQPIVKVVKNVLESRGWADKNPVKFIADNMAADPRKRRRFEVQGVFDDWRFVRTPRGHEEMPLVRWHPFPPMFGEREPEWGEMWQSLLVCVGAENQEGVMTALPWFTRKPDDPMGHL